jgi:hypothetical protein
VIVVMLTTAIDGEKRISVQSATIPVNGEEATPSSIEYRIWNPFSSFSTILTEIRLIKYQDPSWQQEFLVV